MPAEILGTWPNTAEIGGREVGWRKEGDWSMEEEERDIMNIWII